MVEEHRRFFPVEYCQQSVRVAENRKKGRQLTWKPISCLGEAIRGRCTGKLGQRGAVFSGVYAAAPLPGPLPPAAMLPCRPASRTV